MSRSLVNRKSTLLLGKDRLSISRAAKIIKKGGLVAFPTETVYGLGASAFNADAIKSIYKAKGRPQDNPLIIHLSDQAQLDEVATDVPEAAYRLIEKFWPGPLSLVLSRAGNVPAVVSAGLSTVAVRMPDHQAALDLIKASAVPIAAPSANRSGKPSPTSFRHVIEDLSGRIDAVIKSEDCIVGIESTVLDMTAIRPVILRPGGVSREEIEMTLGSSVLVAGLKISSGGPISPGMKYRHYSPRAPLILITGPVKRRQHLIKAINAYYQGQGLKVGLLNSIITEELANNLSVEYLAAHLFQSLRRLDHQGVDLILAEETVTTGIGLAVMNRLRKAATRVLRV